MQRPNDYEALINEWDAAEAAITALQKLHMSVCVRRGTTGMLTAM
jgi:hypothetical protein